MMKLYSTIIVFYSGEWDLDEHHINSEEKSPFDLVQPSRGSQKLFPKRVAFRYGSIGKKVAKLVFFQDQA